MTTSVGCQTNAPEAHAGPQQVVGLHAVPAEACSLVAAAGFTVIHDYKFETGNWQGPVRSGFGLHLVYVYSITRASLPVFDDMREKVLINWRRISNPETSM